MPEGPDGKTIIIVKKVSGHGGHHGGAWKVAYADFVTAMMALFLVLWLVNSASVVTKQAIASYFRRPGVFELGSGTPLEVGGSGILSEAFAPPADENAQVIAHSKIYESRGEGFKPIEEQKAGKAEEQAEFEEVAREVKGEIARQGKALEGALGQVDVKVDQRGLHIEIMDTPTASMFQLGSAAMLPDAQQALLDIANIVHKLPNPIDIEGHTDAKPFRSAAITGYDNWNLSTDRANEARRILQRSGIADEQIARVVGYANQRPKDPLDPFNPANRRISISMRYTEQAAAALTGTNFVETKSIPKQQANERNAQPSVPTKSEAPAEATPNPPVKTDLGVTSESGGSKNGAPAEAPDLAAGQSRIDERSGLRVEVGTSLPEGSITQQADETPARPVWMQKDKIFGDENPFLE